MLNANKCRNLVSAIHTSLDPTHIYTSLSFDCLEDATVAAPNVTLRHHPQIAQICSLSTTPMPHIITAVTIESDHTIPNTYRPRATRARHTMASAAGKLFGCPTQKYLNALTIATTHAITDTGTTFIFIMDGVNVVNSFTPIRVPAGMKNSRPVGFLW